LRIIGKPERIDTVISLDCDLSPLIRQNLNKGDLVRILGGICDSYLRAIWGEFPEIHILWLGCHLCQLSSLAFDGIEFRDDQFLTIVGKFSVGTKVRGPICT